MNVYQKMAVVKQLVNSASFKKSGENRFAGFKYYELGDFLPFVTEACANNGLLVQVSFTPDLASLVVINAEQPEERIDYTIPFIVPEVKGANACQNAGAAQTYSRRYLYLTAFDIVENDGFDATLGKEKDQQQAEQNTKKRDADIKAEKKKAEQAVTILTDDKTSDAYDSLRASWEMTGRAIAGLEPWIRTEAVEHGIKEVGAKFLAELDERIVNYMAKKGA